MTELAGEPVGTTLQRAAGHDATTNPRAECDQHHVAGSGPGAEQPLGGGCARCVVVDVHIRAHSFREQFGDGEIGHTVEIRSGAEHAGTGDQSRHPDADAAFVAEEIGQFDQDIDQRTQTVLATGSGTLRGLDHLAARVDRHGLRFGSAHVDPDAAGRHLACAAGRVHASARAFNSRTVLRMRTSARRLTNPGSGIARSISRS